jgi:hypothetical protein
MQASDVPNVYIAVGAGFAMWWIGQKCGGRKALGTPPSKLGKLLSFAGFAVFAVAMYAGFKGPLTIAGVTLETFPFSRMIEQVSAEALTYAKNNLDINREPAPGWHGASKTALQYIVKNNGDKEIGRMTVRFSTTDGSSVDLPLCGPFPAGKTTTAIMEVPSKVKPSYFHRAKADPGDIVGARY